MQLLCFAATTAVERACGAANMLATPGPEEDEEYSQQGKNNEYGDWICHEAISCDEIKKEKSGHPQVTALFPIAPRERPLLTMAFSRSRRDITS